MATVREARDRYLDENGFDLAGYTAPTFELPIFRWKMKFRNPPARQKAVPLHDLHHVATGYGTDYIGEGEIGAWELVAGCNTFITYFLNGGAFLFGLVIAPRRMMLAWSRARGSKTLYRKPLDYERALA